MVNKNKNGDLYSTWYNISNEMGKQFLDVSSLNNLDYGTIQESWQGYSDKFNEQFNKLLKFDDNSYKDMTTLWDEFTNQMNSQLSSLNVYEKANYTQWYDSWLEYTDKMNKDIQQVIQKQLKQQSELFDSNDLWAKKFGFNDDHKQQMIEASKIMSDYYQDVTNKTAELVKESINSKHTPQDFSRRVQELHTYWFDSCSNMFEHLGDIFGFGMYAKFDLAQTFPGFQAVYKIITDNLQNFGYTNKNDYSKIESELEELKKQVDVLTTELEKHNGQNNKSSTSRSRKKK
jgi:predicted  nucleic acid-binding Zn-ribbon protein